MARSIEKSTAQVNKKRKPNPQYYPGENILILKPRVPKMGETKKFLPSYTKVYTIKKKLSDLLYTAVPAEAPDAKPEMVHVSKIKRYFLRRTNSVTIASPVQKIPVKFRLNRHIVQKYPVNTIWHCIYYALQDLDVTGILRHGYKNNPTFTISYDIYRKYDKLLRDNKYIKQLNIYV
jgi:hypothetical protein